MQIENNFYKLIEQLNNVNNLVNEAGAAALKDAKDSVAVKSGELRDSLKLKKGKKNEITIYSELDYAILVEKGTRKQKAQPFLKESLDRQEKKLVRKVKSAVFKKI